ncbi:hypothetical protein V6B16_09045 [Salinimicrobium catena]|uniref:hypothetical protein n=1 Tax=Salinimicrobium catena TaxID=390640 RepID=UPI002FE46FFC
MRNVNYLFITFSTLFIAGEIFSYLTFTQPWWIRNYLNDLLCMPVVLGICLHLVRFMKNDRTIRISLFTTISLAVFYSLYFEIILPPITERYTADVFDVLLYFTGALLFYFMQKPAPKAPAVHKK